MNGAAIGAAGALLVAVLAAAAGIYVTDMRGDLTRTRADLEAAQAKTTERDATIRQLLERDRRNNAALAALKTTQTGIQSSLAARETTMRKLEDENAELRAWAAVPVPDPVVRLLEHGPLTGAAAYRERMSPGAAVHAAGGDGGQ